jgi:hypothetical protein
METTAELHRSDMFQFAIAEHAAPPELWPRLLLYGYRRDAPLVLCMAPSAPMEAA